MKLIALAAAALALGACGLSLDFSRRVSEEENILRSEVHGYYAEVASAFAAGNPDLLASLFAPGITHPMTREQVRAWGETFFKQHGPARFKVVKLDFESVGHVSAVVELTYRVETRDGAGSFGGVERDQLVRKGGRWFTAAWDKER